MYRDESFVRFVKNERRKSFNFRQMYWGEFPLSFAACTNQQDAFRLLKAFKVRFDRDEKKVSRASHQKKALEGIPRDDLTRAIDLKR